MISPNLSNLSGKVWGNILFTQPVQHKYMNAAFAWLTVQSNPVSPLCACSADVVGMSVCDLLKPFEPSNSVAATDLPETPEPSIVELHCTSETPTGGTPLPYRALTISCGTVVGTVLALSGVWLVLPKPSVSECEDVEGPVRLCRLC